MNRYKIESTERRGRVWEVYFTSKTGACQLLVPDLLYQVYVKHRIQLSEAELDALRRLI